MSPALTRFLRTAPGGAQPPRAPLLEEYRVGIVVSRQGLNDKQLLELAARLDFIAKQTAEAAPVHVFVPGFSLDPGMKEEGVDRALRNMLERKEKAVITYIGMPGDHKAGVAVAITKQLTIAHRCDEIWCCPSLGQTENSVARVAQVWRLGQASPVPARFKLIPPWVEPPVPPAKTPTKPKTKGNPPWAKNRFR